MEQRFTPAQRIAIMDEYITTKVEQKELAKKYHVCQSTISSSVTMASIIIVQELHRLKEDRDECAKNLNISRETVDVAYRKIYYN